MTMRNHWTLLGGGVLSLTVLLLPLPAARAGDPPQMSEEGIITGTMDIDFKTRTTPDTSGEFKPGSPALGVRDMYRLNLTVAKTTQFTGTIMRQGNIFSKTLGRLKQSAAMDFDITLSVLNPSDLKQKKTVGKWIGNVPVNTESGAYSLDNGGERRLRIVVDTVGGAKGFNEFFTGSLVGKAEKKESLASYTYKRVMGSKTVEVKVKTTDPMRFDNIVLAKGPAEIYPRTSVNGRLDYDYETGNWYTDGIRFKYMLDGKEYEDVVTGGIKWVEDPNRETNGKGKYEFNLRFNEDKNKPAAGEADAFKDMKAEDAFFAVDDKIPSLTGEIAYVDTMTSGGKLPASSKITYNLNANKLTKQQVMNFFKLWLICVGPTNDE